jgi:chromosomal replication initiation ATPase DnaA
MHHADTCELVEQSSYAAELHRAHVERQQRIKAAAVGQEVIEAVKTPDEVAKIDNEQADILEKRWAERQKAQWFSIIEEVGPPRIEDIIRAVCKYFSVTRIDLLSARRTRSVTLPRQTGYYLCKILTKNSLPEIGRRFGNRDHTSALSGIRKIERLRKTDRQLDDDLRAVAASLGATMI